MYVFTQYVPFSPSFVLGNSFGKPDIGDYAAPEKGEAGGIEDSSGII